MNNITETSNCCYAQVDNPSGTGNEGVCMDCGEHCAIERTIEVKILPESGLVKLVRKPLTIGHLCWIPF